jgi:hypothetical protein
LAAVAENVPLPEEKLACKVRVWVVALVVRLTETIIVPNGVTVQFPLADKLDPLTEQLEKLICV